MKKILVIGSTVADVMIEIDHLPGAEEDIIPKSQKLSLGGCAYNVSNMLRLFQIPYILFSPVGTGIYGEFVKKELEKQKIRTTLLPQQENGCCYCLIDKSGNRTFMAVHGAEYQFQKEWFDQIDKDQIDGIYVCGLEMEEPSGEEILRFLESCPNKTIYYAPGPRIISVPESRQKRLYELHPVLHLNAREAGAWLKKENKWPKEAVREKPDNFTTAEVIKIAEMAAEITGNTVIVTNGEAGTVCFDLQKRQNYIIPAKVVKQIDGTGAGDAHIGTYMACKALGDSDLEALTLANHVSELVVGCKGAVLSDAFFRKRFERNRTDCFVVRDVLKNV